MSDDLDFVIKTKDGARDIRVSPYDDGVWLSMSMSGCNSYTSMTKDEAQELIEALMAVLNGAE
jgi:hypothetical protein